LTLQLGYWDGRPWVQIVGVYAAAIQAFIHESFGDPMMSAIDFGSRPPLRVRR